MNFFNAVFFIDPVTNTVDDSLVMSLSKDPLNSDRYSKFLQVRSRSSAPPVDDQTNFALCLPRSVQSLSDHHAFNDNLSSFIRSLLPTVHEHNNVVDEHNNLVDSPGSSESSGSDV